MLTKLKNLFGRRKSRPEFPTFTVVMEPEGVMIHADWPDPGEISPQQAEHMAGNIAQGIHILTRGTGEGYAAFQRAICKATSTRGNDHWVEQIMEYLNRINVQFQNLPTNRPLMRPSDALSFTKS